MPGVQHSRSVMHVRRYLSACWRSCSLTAGHCAGDATLISQLSLPRPRARTTPAACNVATLHELPSLSLRGLICSQPQSADPRSQSPSAARPRAAQAPCVAAPVPAAAPPGPRSCACPPRAAAAAAPGTSGRLACATASWSARERPFTQHAAVALLVSPSCARHDGCERKITASPLAAYPGTASTAPVLLGFALDLARRLAGGTRPLARGRCALIRRSGRRLVP